MKVTKMATVRKRGNSYQIRASAGYDANGEQIVKSMTWKPTPGMTAKQIEKELQRVKIDFERRVESGQYLDGNIRFGEFADKWIREYAEKQLAPSTVVSYRRYLKRTNEAIGHIRLDKLQPQHLLEFYSNLAEEGIREDFKFIASIDLVECLIEHGFTQRSFSNQASISKDTVNFACKGKKISMRSAETICMALNMKIDEAFHKCEKRKLSGNTLLHYHHLISSILTTAVQWQVVSSNPADRVKPPKIVPKESGFLDINQARHLVALLENEPIQYKTAILLLLYSGMRRGELCGLEWSDFDFDNCTVNISRTSQYLPGKGVFEKGTKTKGSIRAIRLPGVTFILLREYRKWQTEKRLPMGDQWHETGRLFTSWNGEPISPDILTQWFDGFIKRSDLPPIHLHSLRHTNASMLIASGEDVRTVSGRLGHSQPSTTLNIYSHVIQSADAKASRTLENILDPLKEKNDIG